MNSFCKKIIFTLCLSLGFFSFVFGIENANADCSPGEAGWCLNGKTSNWGTDHSLTGNVLSWKCGTTNCSRDIGICGTAIAAAQSDSSIGAANTCASGYTANFKGAVLAKTCSMSGEYRICGSNYNYHWWWYCGDGNGTMTTCFTEYRQNARINGNCGTANNKAYPQSATSYGSDTQCASGSPSSTAFPTVGSLTTWTCSGAEGGAESATCAAGRLYSLNAEIVSSTIPTTMKAGESKSVTVTVRNTGSTTWNEGTAFRLGGVGDGSGNAAKFSTTRIYITPTGTNVPTNGQYAFTFTMTAPTTLGTYNPQYRMVQDSVAWFGNTQSTSITVSAAAVNGACGTANLKTYAEAVTSYGTDTQCATGTSTNTAFPAVGTAVGWYCNGVNGGTNSPLCAASRVASGSCGSSNGANLSSAPTTNLCTGGTVSAVSGTGPWTWVCSGINGGVNSNCSANKITNGACGTANAKTYAVTATSYGTDTQCATGTSTNTAFPAAGSSTTWTCNGLYGGTASTSCSASRTAANVIVLNSFKNAFDLLPTDKLSADQCLWCDWYEQQLKTGDVISKTSAGKSGSLGFSFYYGDNVNYRLKTLSLLVSPTTNIADGKQIDIAKNVDPGSTITFGESSAPFVKADTVSTLTVDTVNNTIKIPYDGKTYYWWIKVINTNNEDSGWISATGKQLTMPDHKWPTVAIQYPTDITVNTNTQFCSTSSFGSTDPCYSTCWKGSGTPTNSSLTTKDWKCSVCYNVDGTPTLCQNKTGTTFKWEDGGTALFPTTDTKPSWWKYTGENNGREARNPIIKPTSTQSILKLKITGSDCPFGGSISGGKINPNWKEN